MKNFYLTLTLVMSLLASHVTHAQDIYMKVTLNRGNEVITTNTLNQDPVRDNGTSLNLNQYVPVTSLQYDLEQTLNLGSQTGGSGAGKINFNPITITKFTDESSTKLMQSCAQGELLKIEFITVSTSQRGQGEVTYKIRTTQAAVKTFSGSTSGECSNCAGLAESFTFDYTNLEVFTYKTLPNGNIQQNTTRFSWDRNTNRPLN